MIIRRFWPRPSRFWWPRPGTLAALTEPGVLADVAILDACAHIPAIELLSIIGRVQQVVVIAHCATVTSESVKQLIDTLPHIEVDAAPSRRAPRLSAFLESEGYGPVRYDVATEPAAVRCDSTVWKRAVCRLCLLVWWNPASPEIDEVVRLITQRAAGFAVVPSSYRLVVVMLTDAFRTRLGAELKSLAGKSKAMGRFLRHVRLVSLA